MSCMGGRIEVAEDFVLAEEAVLVEALPGVLEGRRVLEQEVAAHGLVGG